MKKEQTIKHKNNYKWILFFICLILFIILTKNVLKHQILQQDIIIYNALKTYLLTPTLTPYIKAITNLGGATCLIIITAVIFITIKNKKIGFLTLINLVTITILNQIIKHIIQRPRPTYHTLIKETGYSYPSGHSMISMAFYGFLIYLIYKNLKNKALKITLITFLSLLILAIGLSRIYLGVHYISDVIGGLLISTSYLILYINIINKKIK